MQPNTLDDEFDEVLGAVVEIRLGLFRLCLDDGSGEPVALWSLSLWLAHLDKMFVGGLLSPQGRGWDVVSGEAGVNEGGSPVVLVIAHKYCMK